MTLAITVDQPYASLIVRGVKTIETRPSPGFPVPGVRKLPGCTLNRGDRVLIHASARRPRDVWVDAMSDRGIRPTFAPFYDSERYCQIDESADGGWFRYRWTGPLGAIVGSAVLVDCVPIVVTPNHGPHSEPPTIPCVDTTGVYWWHHDGGFRVCDDQLPLGDFRQGRWAWLLGDAAPVEERCPACDGQGVIFGADDDDIGDACEACDGDGVCAPIPWKGKQGIWQVTW